MKRNEKYQISQYLSKNAFLKIPIYTILGNLQYQDPAVKIIAQNDGQEEYASMHIL